MQEDQDSDTVVDYDYDANGALVKNAKGERFTYDMESHQTEFFEEGNSAWKGNMNYSHTDRTVPSRLAGPVFFVLLFGACNVDTSPLHNRETKDTNKEDKRTEERLTSERKVVKKGGWLKIDISRSSIKQSREPVKGHRGVFFSTIVPQQEVVIELNCDGIDRENSYVDACDRYPFGSTYSVLEAMAYDVGHKVFCLNVVVRKISNGNKGGPLLISIFDEDGDGLFETLYTSASMSTFHVPEWLTGAS